MRRVVRIVVLVLLVIVSVAVLRSPLAVAQNATPQACPVTTAADNEAIARRWHDDAINGHDLDVVDEIVAGDVVHHAGTFPDGVGPDAVKTVLGALLTGFPDVRHTIEQTIANDDLVVVRWTAEGTQTGEFQGHAPSGQRATWTGINIFRIECGRIAEEWSEVDGVGRLRQLGLIAEPAG